MFKQSLTKTYQKLNTNNYQSSFFKYQKNPFSFLLHEYQAQNLLKSFNVPTPKGQVIKQISETKSALDQMGKTTGYAVKAQAHTGGRGLGHFKENNFQGGVHVVDKSEQVSPIVDSMLGKTLVTKQTGESGIPCNAIYLVEKVDVMSEKYLSITLDRKHQSPVILASSQGGVNIEDIAEKTPEAIKVLPVNIITGLSMKEAENFAESIGYKGDLIKEAAEVICNLYKTFLAKDCLMIEINPFATVRDPTTKKEKVLIIDSKVSVDDNAAFRQKDIEAIIDNSGKNKIELEAESYGLNFIRLDGSIGCLVNGAGLAMATMDIIKLHGGAPANFLDVGGAADMEAMVQALRILNADSQVEAILVNIFGGILRCDDLVNAIIDGTKRYNLKKNIVLRLKGTNSDIAKETITKSNFSNISFNDDLDSAARQVVGKK